MAAPRKRTATPKEDTQESAMDVMVPPVAKSSISRSVPVTPEELIVALNTAVSSVTATFQLRDHLQAEMVALKEELSIGRDIKLEKTKLEAMKRDQEQFLYDCQLRKDRLEKELETREVELEERLARQQDEAKIRLKAETDAQALQLKLAKEEQVRTIQREREDWERVKAQFLSEKTSLDEKQKKLETDRGALRERLVQELNKDNAHAVEILNLNHQREMELTKGELKLEQAQRAKFEALLQEAKTQIDKLSDQLAGLSKEALASAGSANVAARLKDIVSQMTHSGGQVPRVS